MSENLLFFSEMVGSIATAISLQVIVLMHIIGIRNDRCPPMKSFNTVAV